MPDSGSQQVGPALPQFEDKKIYLVRGKSLNDMEAAIRSGRAKVVIGGGLEVASTNDQGTYLRIASANTLALGVCINGSLQTKTFVVLD
jgi:hypothetical protein